MDILNVLEKATQINSVSGSENEIRKFISDKVILLLIKKAAAKRLCSRHIWTRLV